MDSLEGKKRRDKKISPLLDMCQTGRYQGRECQKAGLESKRETTAFTHLGPLTYRSG